MAIFFSLPKIFLPFIRFFSFKKYRIFLRCVSLLGSSFSLLFYVESRFGWPNGSEINRRLVIYEVSCTFSISRISMHVPTIPRDCSLTGIKVEYEKSRARFFARWITRCVKRIPSYTILIYEKSRLKRWWRCRGTIVGDLV